VPGQASNRSASNNDLVKQSTRFKLGERACSVAGRRASGISSLYWPQNHHRHSCF